MKYFIAVVVAVVGVAAGISLYVVGSPGKARLRRFDDIRVQNLQFIQDQVFSYWVDTKTVPARLIDLNDDIRQVRIPLDPSTGESYTYEKKGNEQFIVCANFALSNEPSSKSVAVREPYPYYYGYYVGDNLAWEHGVGMTCFTRTIDKERYQQGNKPL